MTSTLNEAALAASLCADLLTAPELETLCKTRGFPVVGGGKAALAKAAAARFLEPGGVPEAMATLDPRWLAALHLVASADGPVSPSTLARVVDANRDRYSMEDDRASWRKTTAGLLSRGVALAVDGPASSGGSSRFSRLGVVLPSAFARFLPPFPIEAPAVSTKGAQGDLDAVFSGALELRTQGKPHTTTSSLASRIAAKVSLEKEVLSISSVTRPDAEHLARFAFGLFRSSLGADKGTEVSSGPAALQILGSLATGTACSAAALTDALEGIGFTVKLPAVQTFLDEGVAAGFLLRFDRPRRDALFRRPPSMPLPSRDTLQLAASPKGVKVVSSASGMAPLLQAATVGRVSIVGDDFVLEPDPVRFGRAWLDLPLALRESLVAASRAFRDAAEIVGRNAGKVIVHRRLTLLRVEDAGLVALLRQRFADAVRPLDDRYLACLAGRIDEVLSLCRKEGYVTRRLP